MLESRFDQATGIFYGTYRGVIDIAQLYEGLRLCFEVPVKPVLVLWDVSDAEVGFSLEDVTVLGDQIQVSIAVPGKMAFVYGGSMFMRAVVESVRDMRGSWQTTWKTFESAADAESWLLTAED